jgi:hypothetical protein
MRAGGSPSRMRKARRAGRGRGLEILADIRQADQRAADIITHLRQLLKKRSEIDLQEFNVNDAMRHLSLHRLGLCGCPA